MTSLSNVLIQIQNTINLANHEELKEFCTHNNINTVDAVDTEVEEAPTNKKHSM